MIRYLEWLGVVFVTIVAAMAIILVIYAVITSIKDLNEKD
jgi:hypothetical protein